MYLLFKDYKICMLRLCVNFMLWYLIQNFLLALILNFFPINIIKGPKAAILTLKMWPYFSRIQWGADPGENGPMSVLCLPPPPTVPMFSHPMRGGPWGEWTNELPLPIPLLSLFFSHPMRDGPWGERTNKRPPTWQSPRSRGAAEARAQLSRCSPGWRSWWRWHSCTRSSYPEGQNQCCGSGSDGIKNFEQDPDPEKSFRIRNEFEVKLLQKTGEVWQFLTKKMLNLKI